MDACWDHRMSCECVGGGCGCECGVSVCGGERETGNLVHVLFPDHVFLEFWFLLVYSGQR